MEKKIIGLMLLETERENEYWRIGIFETLGDEALKLLTRPTYPFEKAPEGEGGDSVPVGRIKSKKALGWPFQRNPWVESVMNIVWEILLRQMNGLWTRSLRRLHDLSKIWMNYIPSLW
jgi:hypothetical protein